MKTVVAFVAALLLFGNIGRADDDPAQPTKIVAGQPPAGAKDSDRPNAGPPCPVYVIMNFGTTCYWCFVDCATGAATSQGYAPCGSPKVCNGATCGAREDRADCECRAADAEGTWVTNPWFQKHDSDDFYNQFEVRIGGEHLVRRSVELVDDDKTPVRKYLWDENGLIHRIQVVKIKLKHFHKGKEKTTVCWAAFEVDVRKDDIKAFDTDAKKVVDSPVASPISGCPARQLSFNPQIKDGPDEVFAVLRP